LKACRLLHRNTTMHNTRFLVDPSSMNAPRQFFIQGTTLDGRTFRPSDWAERLAGAMACFRPGGAKGGIGSFIGYSPYCVPRQIGGVKNVIVDERLKALEPMAWDFVMNFARDNALHVVEGTLQPDGTFTETAPPPAPKTGD
jgi:hypothetical protein